MFLMVAEAMRLRDVAARFPQSRIWELLGEHQEHVEWRGCSLHDLIQPSFSFIVGVALPFSLANRLGRGQSKLRLGLHAFWRALILILLGIFLRSMGRPLTNFTFEDTLTQIGLGYGFLFLVGLRPRREQWIALATILIGFWLAFAWHPLPPEGFDPATVGVPKLWEQEHWLSGFAAHWNKNANLSWRFDTWFLNLFPRERAFEFNGGGYATLSFIPTLATMILGLIAGGVLREDLPARRKLAWLGAAGAIGLAAGAFLDLTGICPTVKRIWTPSWVLFSGGWCFLFLAAFYLTVDVAGGGRFRLWAYPLVVIGLNSIAIYCMSWTMKGFVRDTLRTHLGPRVFEVWGEAYTTIAEGAAILLVFWLVLFWMHRRRIYLRV